MKTRLFGLFALVTILSLATLRASVGFAENAQLVCSSKPAPLGLRNDFRGDRDSYLSR